MKRLDSLVWGGIHPARRIYPALVLFTAALLSAQPGGRGSYDDAQYSPSKQVDKSNVAKLELAWHFPVPGSTGRFGFRPLVVDGTMYVLGAKNAIVALDAATGRTIWTHPVEGGRPT